MPVRMHVVDRGGGVHGVNVCLHSKEKVET
jgi:hypothetical protein